MNGHPSARLIVYILFALLVISSVILAMPGAFSPTRSNHMVDTTGNPLPEGQHRLHIGQTVSVQGIPFTFTKVESDNRCPEGDQCLTSGHAVIILHVIASATEEDVRVDSTTSTNYTPFSIRLISLTPTPTTGDASTEAIIEILNTSNVNQ
jgi:hypothetical protein